MEDALANIIFEGWSTGPTGGGDGEYNAKTTQQSRVVFGVAGGGGHPVAKLLRAYNLLYNGSHYMLVNN